MPQIRGIHVPKETDTQNLIINGTLDFWQRGTSGTTGYIADRMYVGGATATVQSTDVPNATTKYSLKITQSAASFGFFKYRVESNDARQLYGKTLTLSFWAKSSLGTSSLYIDVNYATSVDNFSSVTPVYAAQTLAATPSSSWTQYTYTFAVTANMASNGFEFLLVRSNSTSNETYYAQLMLNVGTVAAPFKRHRETFNAELAACQRYYEKSYSLTVAPGSVATEGMVYFYTRAETGSRDLRTTVRFSVPKRAQPVINPYGGTGSATPKIDRFSSSNNTPSPGHLEVNQLGFTMADVSTDAGYRFHWTADAEF